MPTEEEVPDNVKLYLREIAQFKNLQEPEEARLGRIVQKGKGKDATESERQAAKIAMQKLVNHNLQFVVHYIKKHFMYRAIFLELIQAGNIGLLQAVGNFDPDHVGSDGQSYRLTTYAAFWIKQAVIREINNQRLIPVPQHMVERERVIRHLIEQFNQQGQGNPTPEELLEALDIYLAKRFKAKYGRDPRDTAELEAFATTKSLKMDANAIQQALHLPDTVSWETQVSEGDNELGDLIAAPVEEPEDIDHKELMAILTRLDDLPSGVKIRKIIAARIGLLTGRPMRLREVGGEIGHVRERVRQLEALGLNKLGGNVRRAISGLLPTDEEEE